MSVRIIGLDEVSTIQDGNYIAIDSETGGTKKFDATKVGYLMGQNIAADYNSSAQYVVGEFCMYNGKLYKCTTNITTPEAWTAGHWTQVTVGTSLYDKVDKVSGKGLSANDFTDVLKNKLDNIASGAQVNVIDGVKVDGVALTPDGNKDVDIVGKANQSSIAEQYSTTANYVRGDYVIYGTNLYKCLQSTTGTWNADNWEQVDVGTELEGKANIDGLYEGMTVGGATQLISNTYEIDQVPYNFRTSGGSIDIGDREIDEIVGGSLVWNQLVNPQEKTDRGITYTVSNGVITCSATSATGSHSTFIGNTYLPLQGHKLLVILTNNLSGAAPQLRAYYGEDVYHNYYASTIFKEDTFSRFQVRLGSIEAGGTVSGTFSIMLFDLTAMFGSTIADYIYSLEQANAGAGVAWFKKLFPKPYYEYNAGELMSVKAASHETTGFNQWDEEWESNKTYNNSGVLINAAGYGASKNLIRVLPNMVYYFKSPNVNFEVLEYDSTKTYIRRKTSSLKNATFTTSSDAHYIAFGSATINAYVTYNHDICINLHWDGERDGEYEPYVKHTYPLDNTLELRGIPKLDSNNQLYFDGDTYESDGTVDRKYDSGYIFKDLAWNWDSTRQLWTSDSSTIDVVNARIKPALNIYTLGNILANGYTVYTWNELASNYSNIPDKSCGISTTGLVRLKDLSVTSTSYNAIKSLADTIVGVWEKPTPTTEQAQPYTNPQIVDDWGTEEYTDYACEAGDRDVEIPVGHDTKYTANLRAKIEMAPDSPSGNGDYIMRQANGTNSYVPLVIPNELPAMPTTDGDWVLRCTVSSGTATLSWVSAT